MTCHIHKNHDHVHGKDCGHTAIQHGDHIDDHGAIEVANA